MKNNKKIVFIVVAMIVLALYGVVIAASFNNKVSETSNLDRGEVTVVDPQTGQKITFGKDGLVIITNPDGTTRKEIWDSDKIASFMAYINGVYGEANNYSIVFASDELIESISEGDGGGSGGGGEDITQYFSTPTPPPGGGGSGNGSGSGGGNNDSDGDGIADDDVAPSWCKYWRLSYCADPITKASPTPSSSYPPGVIIADDCDDWNAQSGDKSVISGSSCSKFSPTPSPQPI